MIKMVIAMRTDLGMNAGKMCAQAAHAAMIFMLPLTEGLTPTEEQRDWLFGKTDIPGWDHGRMAKIVVAIPSGEELQAVFMQAEDAGLTARIIIDKTLQAPTCCAIGPHAAEAIDKITGALPLLRKSS